jgi:hypothetical protein
MAFKTRKKEEFSYSSPQEMYQDNKLKKIMGPIDYQAAMLELYNKNIDKKTVALELPTGSGKTLVGLLIGEYRRRKNKEKILFLCPTNQLVNQVVEQSNMKYGLKAVAFCGKQKDYLSKDKTKFLMADAIGVTTYSSFFALHSFFDDVDVIIMDDVHSSEDYIISNWTVQIDDKSTSFSEIVELLKPYISETDYQYLLENEHISGIASWCNMLPMPLVLDKLNEFQIILQQGIEKGSSNYYAYLKISENLKECNIYIANRKILIRPWIAPTMFVKAFVNAKQRILMSATLGRSGELERITGIENIFRLPIVNDWDKKGLGRKFFTFPDLSLGIDERENVVKELQNLCKKSVFLVPDVKSANAIKKIFEVNLESTKIFEAKDIEESKKLFVDTQNATVILANRFDGIDFSDDESRLLFIWNLPKTTNLQERFLITRMGASKLYAERIRTRIIQAVGRCSRNASDYSIVCVIGDTIQNDLTKKEKIKQFAPELRAEIQFGLENSTDYSTVKDVLEQAKDFLNRTAEWQGAEDYIVDLRNGYWNEENKVEKQINKKLQESAILELKFQNSIWKKDYKSAFDYASSIVGKLNAPVLNGFKCFWNYMAGCMAYYLFQNGKKEYKIQGVQFLSNALKENISIRWLSGLQEKLFSVKSEDVKDADFFFDCIERIENVFSSIPTLQKMEEKIKSILNNLKSLDGNKFERGHKEFGELLGFISENPNSTGAPDPYWIINENNLVVSEDKIYEEKEQVKKVPISDVSEAGRHRAWIVEHERRITRSANVYTVLITNSSGVDDDARIYAEDIYYVNRKEYVEWAVKSLTVIRSVWNTFSDIGESEWREAVHKEFINAGITPKNYLDFVCSKKLKDI